MAHVLGKFRKSGLSLRVLRRVFCRRIEPGNNFSKRFLLQNFSRTGAIAKATKIKQQSCWEFLLSIRRTELF